MKKLRFGLMVAALVALVTSIGAAPALATPGDVVPNIVGGRDATQQYGSASLWLEGRHRCTASVITSEWALTAAHCQNILVPGQTQVRASSLDTTNDPELVGLAEVVVHPDYDPEFLNNDLALIRFDRPLERTKPLPILLNPVEPGMQLRVAGWGWVCEDLTNPTCGRTVNVLQELDVTVLPSTDCEFAFDPKNQLCLISTNQSFAMACYGDSGGPQLRNISGRWALVGVTSHDGGDWEAREKACSTDPGNQPGTGVGTKVVPYIPWILQTLSSDSRGNTVEKPVFVQG